MARTTSAGLISVYVLIVAPVAGLIACILMMLSPNID
jgi:hypothetical protein